MSSSPSIYHFQGKTVEIFKGLPNVFGIADDKLVIGYYDDGRDHGNTLQGVLLICREVNVIPKVNIK